VHPGKEAAGLLNPAPLIPPFFNFRVVFLYAIVQGIKEGANQDGCGML